MEQVPIRGGAGTPDNVVRLPGGVTSDAEPETETVPETPPDPGIGALIHESVRIMGGFVSATSSAVTTALRDMAPPPRPGEEEEEDEQERRDGAPKPGPSPVGLATGAAVGLTMQVSEAAVRAATSFADAAGPLLSWITNTPLVRRGANDVEARAEALNDRWSQERPTSEEAASSFASRVLPEITSAIMDRLDLTQIAIDHLDIDRILDSVDLDAVIDRVDLNAVIHRVDLARIATEVIGEIDLPELIRDSTGAVTSETVRIVRMRSAGADLLLGRIVDRMLMRTPVDDGSARSDEPGEGSAG